MVYHIYAMKMYYRPVTLFYTIVLDDINNPTSFRFTQQFYNNFDFPSSVDDSFIKVTSDNLTILKEVSV